MSSIKKIREQLWEKQGLAFRDPVEVMIGNYHTNGVVSQSLKYKIYGSFLEILSKLKITLLVTREYEHLVTSITVSKNNMFRQSFFILPHPSGLAVNRKTKSVYIVTTRNPNQIWELKPTKDFLERIDYPVYENAEHYLMPSRVIYMCGAYYLHDLTFVGDRLYANSVGQNGIVEINFDQYVSEKIVWWPKCIEDENGKPNHSANFLQLNSISGGESLEKAFFSASSNHISYRRPGHRNYPVDRRGVIFSGKTREVFATGLTRPHSARLYKNRIWVDNSGYGEVGYIDSGFFKPVITLPGWTRGLCFKDDVMFVGVSHIIPRFRMYAPGIKTEKQLCGVYAIDIKKNVIIGSILWPYGNQIFSIDWINNTVSTGFPFEKVKKIPKKIISNFYAYKL